MDQLQIRINHVSNGYTVGVDKSLHDFDAPPEISVFTTVKQVVAFVKEVLATPEPPASE